MWTQLKNCESFTKLPLSSSVPGLPAAIEVGTIGWATDWRKGNPLSADPDVVFRIARMEGELGRRGFQRLLDDVAADAHPVPTTLAPASAKISRASA